MDTEKDKALVETMVEDVLTRFHDKIRGKFATQETFEFAMIMIRFQAMCQLGYGGFVPAQIFENGPFAGGMDECVLSNIMYCFGLSCNYFGDKPAGFDMLARLYPIVLAEAMRSDADLHNFVQSVIIGAIKRRRNFKSKEEKKLLRAIKQELKETLSFRTKPKAKP